MTTVSPGPVEAPAATGIADGRDPGGGARPSVALAGPLAAAPLRSPGRRGRLGFWLAVAWLGLVVAVAALADLLPLAAFDRLVGSLPARTPPGFRATEPLGTDVVGRSMASRLAFGARQSLLVGVFASTIAAVLGTAVGVTAGYLRGRADRVVGVLLDTLLAFPPLVLLLAIASVGARSTSTVIFGLAILGTPIFARLARARALALADREFVTAARALGASRLRIIVREVLPHVVPVVSVFVFLFMGVAMIVEGSLSFLGLGIPPPTPSWGGMVNDGRTYLEVAPHLVLTPATCLVLTALSFRVVGERFNAAATGPGTP